MYIIIDALHKHKHNMYIIIDALHKHKHYINIKTTTPVWTFKQKKFLRNVAISFKFRHYRPLNINDYRAVSGKILMIVFQM